jgi:hypothetical protein
LNFRRGRISDEVPRLRRIEDHIEEFLLLHLPVAPSMIEPDCFTEG